MLVLTMCAYVAPKSEEDKKVLNRLTLSGIVMIMVFTGMLLANGAVADLVGYWSFDEDDGVTDLSGTGNDGVIVGNPETVEGVVGEALELNGSTDYVEIPDSPSISEMDELSLSAWVRPSSLGPWIAIMEKAVHQNWSYGFFIEADSTLSLEVCLEGNNLVCCIGNFVVEIGEWYHIVCIYDSKSAKLYVDGNLEGEMAAAGPLNITEFPFTIGSRNGQNLFPGAIDEVTLWNEAVTLKEIENVSSGVAVKPLDKMPVTWAKIKSSLQ